jgi:hypothetical protein
METTRRQRRAHFSELNRLDLLEDDMDTIESFGVGMTKRLNWLIGLGFSALLTFSITALFLAVDIARGH